MAMTPTRDAEFTEFAEPTELLIRESRVRTRRRRGKAIGALATAIALSALAVSGFNGHRGPDKRPTTTIAIPHIATLPLGSQIPSATVAALTMFSQTAGIAINTIWSASHANAIHSYLTWTSDAGSRWTVVSHLPEAVNSPLLVFLNRSVGYVADFKTANSLRFTNDGGATWSKVSFLGLPTSLTKSGGVVMLTADHCTSGATLGSYQNCQTYLTTLSAGETVPKSAQVVPSIDPALRAVLPSKVKSWTATLVARTGPRGAVVVEGNDGPNALLATANSGSSWSTLNYPCPGLPVVSVTALSASRWYLICSLDGGMSQASNFLFTTTNAGQSWTALAEAQAQGQNRGNLDRFIPIAFGASSSGKFLWLSDSSGFMNVSVDGGRTWRLAGRNLSMSTQQPFVSVGNFGWLANSQGGLIRTLDGIHWATVNRTSLQK